MDVRAVHACGKGHVSTTKKQRQERTVVTSVWRDTFTEEKKERGKKGATKITGKRRKLSDARTKATMTHVYTNRFLSLGMAFFRWK